MMGEHESILEITSSRREILKADVLVVRRKNRRTERIKLHSLCSKSSTGKISMNTNTYQHYFLQHDQTLNLKSRKDEAHDQPNFYLFYRQSPSYIASATCVLLTRKNYTRWCQIKKDLFCCCCFSNTFFLNIPPEPENRTSKIIAKILIFRILFVLIIPLSQWPLSKHYSWKRLLNNRTLLDTWLAIKYHQIKLLWLEIHPIAWLTRGVSLEY